MHMKYLQWCSLMLTLSLGTAGFAYTQNDDANYWQCNAYDGNNLSWSATNTYQKVAMNAALSLCKRSSKSPSSCKSGYNFCIEFNQNLNTRPRWQCTALDEQGTPWLGPFSASRDTAALGALAHCKTNSKLPETCSINLVTCAITVEGVKSQ